MSFRNLGEFVKLLEGVSEDEVFGDEEEADQGPESAPEPERTPGLEGATYRWPADPEVATGARCDAGSCRTAPAGEIRLGAVHPDSTLEGTVTLRFGPDDVLTGGFRAVWRSRRMLC